MASPPRFTSQSFMNTFKVVTYYKFAHVEDPEILRSQLRRFCLKHGIKGTILIAHEGINSTVAGTPKDIDALLAFYHNDPRFADMTHKESFADLMPFYRLKVTIKPEIVTLRQEGVDPTARVGTYIKPENWNALISDPDVVVIDTRNDFECTIGTFKNALNPETKSFSQFPDFVQQHLDANKHKKVAMFCTGGIRCEKATSFMLQKGFEEVYHLEGGILKYLEDVPAEDSLWEGECFVFDQRVTVDHQLQKGHWKLCHACYQPLDEEMMASPLYEAGISCPRCYGKIDEAKLASLMERQKQMKLAEKRHKAHIGQILPSSHAKI